MAQIPIFVINLARQSERLERMSKELGALNLEFERLDAVDRLSTPPAEFQQRFTKTGPIGPLGKGDMACSLSHRKFWKEVLDRGLETAFVLEDDVEISPNLPDLLACADWVPKSANIIKFERKGGPKTRVYLGAGSSIWIGAFTLHRIFSPHMGTAGYLITRKGAELALSASERLSMPVDHFLFNSAISRFAVQSKPLQLSPAVIRQIPDEVPSDIEIDRPAKNRPRMPIRLYRKYKYSALRLPYKIFGARHVDVPFE